MLLLQELNTVPPPPPLYFVGKLREIFQILYVDEFAYDYSDAQELKNGGLECAQIVTFLYINVIKKHAKLLISWALQKESLSNFVYSTSL